MKKIALILVSVLFAACQQTDSVESKPETKDSGIVSTPVNTTDLKLIAEGDFMSANSYTVSGKAKIFEDKDKKRVLIFEDFKTTSGPDLKVYLAEDRASKNFVEISAEVKNGNITYNLDNTINISEKKQVLIWCKQFSRLFGSAELK